MDNEQRDYWIEQVVPWDEPIYPDEERYNEESLSPVDEESGSEFIPSGDISE